jgi:hypothetical protein
MTRLKSLPVALAAVALSAGAVLGYAALPTASQPGLDRASEAAKRVVPARPVQDAAIPAAVPLVAPAAEDTHGSDVSTVATGDDPTPDSNRGADVSAAARANHGQEVAASHRPEDAGPPEDTGKPDDAGAPEDAGKPEGAGKPEAPGQPDDPGPPAGAGPPEDTGRP